MSVAPKISVVLPIYNTKQFLKECMKSLLNQTFQDFEIIMVDDGSTDGTGELCDIYPSKDARIHVIHKKNGGLSSARREGYKSANGKYIIFPDSDDYLEPSMLEKMVRRAEESKADLVICGFNRVTTTTKVPFKLNLPTFLDNAADIEHYLIRSVVGGVKSEQFFDLPTYMWMRLYRTELIEEKFFYSEREYYTEDTLFILEYLKKVETVSVVDEPLYNYRYNENSLTNVYRSNKWEMLYKRQEFYDQYFTEKDYEMSIRLSYSLFYSVFWSLQNEALHQPFSVYKKKFEERMSMDRVKILLKTMDTQYLGPKQKLYFRLLKYKCSFLSYLYFARKKGI